MREARLVGLSQDGQQLVLAMAETGEEFAVPVDDRLRAALRGDRARLGQLEIQMESALRPRDIQARIRAGESPEAVAAVAQMPMERVMAFAGPVLAERDHIANLAQRASVRRRGGGDAPTRNLGAWVTDRLRTRQVDPASAEWDAWRREDGRWAVRVSYFVESEVEAEQKDEKIAMFAYDAPGRYAVPDDDEARWLVGEQPQVVPAPVQPHPGERRLAAVADIDPSLAPDHGADSYEAGFEDTIGLRRRNHPVSRESRTFGRDDESGADRSDFGRDGRGFTADTGRDDGGRDFGVEGGRESGDGRDAGRDFGRETARDAGRESARDAGRGPRRVHSVPNPDEEPTLIDVPLDQPPAPRPSVRAVERPTDPPAYASPAENYAGDRPRPDHPTRSPEPTEPPRSTDQRPAETRTSDPTPSETRPAEARRSEARTSEPAQSGTRPADLRPADPRTAEPTQPGSHPTDRRTTQPPTPESPQSRTHQPDRRPADARSSEPANTSPRPADPRSPESTRPASDAPAASAQPTLPDGADAAQTAESADDTPAEPKKKPARRNKRASVPSWDEIMFGKKAD
ncbi:hypothetical protein GCM10009804_22700 [Kribbella hippodromi]|uniref:DUF3071 domain-containing protein n=1 Tax=Kribbella hippodromi TaxID=434347 RepID=A0ABN2CWI3_9ACTN